MSESRQPYTTETPVAPRVILDAERSLCTRNLNELERDLAELERRLTPLLNTVRAMQGKKPVYVPKG